MRVALLALLAFSRACAWNLRLLRPAAPGTNPWGGSSDMDAVVALRTSVGRADPLPAKFWAREQGFEQQLLAVETVDGAEAIIGTAHLGRLAVGGYLVLRADFLVSTVLVKDAWRRQGVGRALVEELRRRVPSTFPSNRQRLEGACWAVVQSDDAPAATRFFEAIGGSDRGGLADVFAENKLVAAALALSGGAATTGARVFRFRGLCDSSPEYRNEGSLSRPQPAAIRPFAARLRAPPTARAPRWVRPAPTRVPSSPVCKLRADADAAQAEGGAATGAAADVETAAEIKKVDYQVAATVLRVSSPGFSGNSVYQIAWLVQWMVKAVEPSLAAGVDATTMREARALVERVGSDNQREIARLCGQLGELKRLAESAADGGERDEAQRQFAQGQASLQALFGPEQKFEQIF